MREIIASLLPYEIYAWILTGLTIVFFVFTTTIQSLGRFFRKIKNKTSISNKQQGENGNEVIETKKETSETNDHVELEGNFDITQKLLEGIEAERIETEGEESEMKFNELWIMELQENEKTDQEKSNDQKNNEKSQKNSEEKNDIITPEIYNINTNIESINKQRNHLEIIKQEVENLKTRGLMIEYEKKLVQASTDYPDNVYFNTQLGDLYIENGDFKKAQTIYKKLHLQDELDDKSLFKLGIINLELGDLKAAEYLLNKAKELKPENPKYYQYLAETKYNLEKIDECIELMEKAVDLRPTKFEYIEILGKLYKETNNIQLYYKTLLKMNALEPLNQKVRSELHKFQE